jgi:ribosome-associated protein
LLATKSKDKKENGTKKARKQPIKIAARSSDKTRGAEGRAARGKKHARLSTLELALAIARIGLEKKALNVEIIDVQGKVDYADYVVVLSGRSDRQVAALAGYIQEDLTKAKGVRCLSLEGLPHGRWVLMDYGDVVVHVFHEDVRGYYDLESLWIDAARVSVE